MSIQKRQWERGDPLKVLIHEETTARKRDYGCSACKYSENMEKGLWVCTEGVVLPAGHNYCSHWRDSE